MRSTKTIKENSDFRELYKYGPKNHKISNSFHSEHGSNYVCQEKDRKSKITKSEKTRACQILGYCTFSHELYYKQNIQNIILKHFSEIYR